MNLRTLILASALALTGCPETGVRVTPNEGPIAVAQVISVEAGETVLNRIGRVVLGGTASFDGSLSVDPDLGANERLTYQWSLLSRPEGSEAELTVPTDNDATDEDEDAFPTLVPDIEGTYRVQLIVMDADNVESFPAIANLQAVPPSEIEIVLGWDVVRADLDVHLIQPDGTYWGDDDCYAWNPTPDWGIQGFDDDDPLLDEDDDGEGNGPYREVLRLDAPRSGTYQVLVHYFSDHGAALGQAGRTVVPTITITAFGETIAGPVQPPGALAEGNVWRVSELEWPSRSHSPPSPAIVSHTELGGPPVQEQP
jgi:hypothetical protein